MSGRPWAPEMAEADLAAVLRDLVAQQTALLHVHAESVRLQRVLAEHLLLQPSVAPSVAPPAATQDERAVCERDPPPPPPAEASAPASRGARYYHAPAPPASAAPPVRAEDLELLRRLQQLRECSGLILQFGPHRGTSLAQVALHHPDYVRQLVTEARRPEVRAAAGRLVEALEAAAPGPRPAGARTRVGPTAPPRGTGPPRGPLDR